MLFDAGGRSMSPQFRSSGLKTPAFPRRGFSFGGRCSGSGLGDRDARADRQRRELTDRGTAGAPIRKLLFVKLRRHMRMPFARYRPDDFLGVKPAAIDPHRAAEAAADLERGFDDGVAR